jgi:hypothetical protein
VQPSSSLVDSQSDRCGDVGSVTNLYCSGTLSTHILGCRHEELFVDKKLKIFCFLSTKVSTNGRIQHWHCCSICPTLIKSELEIIPYLTRLIKMDRVGFEPTTSAMPMPYPTGLDDRPCNNSRFWKDIKMIRLGFVQTGYKNNNI